MAESLLDYLSNKYEDKITRCVLSFCITNRERIGELAGRDVRFVTIENLDYRYMWLADGAGDSIHIDFLIRPDLGIKFSIGHDDYDSESFSGLYLLLTCRAKIDSGGISRFSIDDIEEYVSKNYYASPLGNDLVEKISHADANRIANEILTKYYPSGVRNFGRIDPWALAHNIGFNVLYRRITKEKNIFGQCFFDAQRATFYCEEKDEYFEESIPSRTIVVDREAALCRSFGAERLTLAHECVHAIKHKKAFYLAKLLSSDTSCISCRTDFTDQFTDNTIKWIEWQANTIAPCILMPEKATKRKIQELYSAQRSSVLSDPLVDTEQVISELAEDYGITKIAAKRRMVDLGYKDAIGCLEWVDGAYLRPFRVGGEGIKTDETYTISLKELASYRFSPQLAEAVFHGLLVYVEGHLVLNDPKYVLQDNGLIHLTDYARLHIDECAVKFQISLKGKTIDVAALIQDGFLRKQADSYFKIEIRNKDGQEIESSEEYAKLLKQSSEENLKLKRLVDSADTLPLAIKALISYRKIPLKQLEIDADLDHSTIERYVTGKNCNPNIRTLLAILHGLNVAAPIVVEAVLRKAGIVLKDTAEDCTLETIICYFSSYSVHEINQYLVLMGYLPLTKSKK
jgi:hypothetical protein